MGHKGCCRRTVFAAGVALGRRRAHPAKLRWLTANATSMLRALQSNHQPRVSALGASPEAAHENEPRLRCA